MIQELLGSGDIKKISTNGAVFESSPPSSSTLPATSSSENQKLRCPRCDSSNTKFCYYNNYNLTQPRHFCKTCRRYWTKGGALRNVPIGGGCRKNRSIPAASASAAGKSSTTAVAFKTAQTSEIGRSEQITNPWVSPQNSHILALLRATQNPNPNPSLGLCSSFWRNNQHDEAQHQHHHHHQQQINGNIVGEVQNSGMQELYQRLRLSTSFYGDQAPAPVVLSNVGFPSSSSSSSTILESAPVAGGDFGYWNPAFSWSDLTTTTNGAYP